MGQEVGDVEKKALCEQLDTLDSSLLFVALIILSVALSYRGLTIQREGLCQVIRGEEPEGQDIFPLRLTASALVVGALGWFFCLAVRMAREAEPGDRAATVNGWASLLVFLAALLRLWDLLEERKEAGAPS